MLPGRGSGAGRRLPSGFFAAVGPAFCLQILLSSHAILAIPEVRIPPPGTDPEFFDILSEIIRARGILLPGLPGYFFTPIYAYLFALVKAFAPDVRHCLAAVVALQTLCFLASVCCFWRLASNLYRRPGAALAATWIYGLFPLFGFFAAVPVKEILVVASLTPSLYFLLLPLGAPEPRRALAAGVFFGLAVHLRGSLAAALPLFLVHCCRGRRISAPLAFLLGTAVLTAPFGLRNALVAGEPVLLSSVGGIHYYIGNNERANGYYAYIPGVRPSGFGHYYDSVAVVGRELGRPVTGVEAGKYWKARANDWIRKHPGDAAALYVKKLALLVNHQEMSNNYNYDHFIRTYGPFRILRLIPYPFSVLLVVGVLGFLFGEFPRRGLLAGAFALLLLASASGFVAGRYRVSLAVFLVFGAGGFVDAALSRALRRRAVPAAAAAVLLAAVTAYPFVPEAGRFLRVAEAKSARSARALEKAAALGPAEFRRHYANSRRKTLAQFTAEPLLGRD